MKHSVRVTSTTLLLLCRCSHSLQKIIGLHYLLNLAIYFLNNLEVQGHNQSGTWVHVLPSKVDIFFLKAFVLHAFFFLLFCKFFCYAPAEENLLMLVKKTVID